MPILGSGLLVQFRSKCFSLEGRVLIGCVSSSHLKQRQDFLKGKRVFTRLWCVKPLQCTWLLRSPQAGSRDKPGQNADKAVVPAVLLPEPSGCETVRYLDPLLGAEASEPYAKDRDDLLQVLV